MSARRRWWIPALVLGVLAVLALRSREDPSPAPPAPAGLLPPAPREAAAVPPPPPAPAPGADAPAAAGAAPGSPPAAAPVPSVRVLDGRTREPLDITYQWPVFRLQRPDGRWEALPKVLRRPDAEGRFPVDFPLPADLDPAGGDPRFLEVDMPGWETARIAMAAIRGPVEAPLQPMAVAVAGRIAFPAEEVASAHVEVFPAGDGSGEPLPRAAGSLARDGRFEIRGLPPGRWILRAAVRSPVPGERWEEEKVLRRVFDHGEEFQDLGDLPLVDPVSVRVRVLDEAGEPVAGELILVDRVEKPLLDFTLDGNHGWMTESLVGSLYGLVTPKDGEGWVTIGMLDPGGAYRFLESEKVIEQPVLDGSDGPLPGPPPVTYAIDTVTFTAPAGPGESVDVELHRREVRGESPREDPPDAPK